MTVVATKKKADKNKVGGVNLEDITFFSIAELPELFNYLEFRAMIVDSTLLIRSEELTLSLTCSNTALEYKQRNSGSETTLSIGSVLSAVQDGKTGSRDVICISHPSGNDLVNLFFKSEKNSHMMFGRVRRIYLYYKPELFRVLNNFADVFEEGLHLGARISSKSQSLIGGTMVEEVIAKRPDENNERGLTEDYSSDKTIQKIQADASVSAGEGISPSTAIHSGNAPDHHHEEVTFDDVINVKIEAPIIIMPQGIKLWVADLGTFEISKAGKEQNRDKETKLEGKETKLFYGECAVLLPNLNTMETKNTIVTEIVEKMDMVVADLEFMVRLFKKKIEQAPGVFREIRAVDLLCEPLSVEFVPGSLESLLKLLHTFSRDSSRETKRLDKMLSRAEYSNVEEVEYNHGYEYWEQIYIIVESQTLHLVTTSKKLLFSQAIAGVFSVAITTEVNQDSRKHLTIKCGTKQIELRSHQLSTLTELKYTLETVMSHLKEEGKALTSHANHSHLANISADYSISLQFRNLQLSVAGYHSKGTPFFVLVDQSVYRTEFIAGIENGSFLLGGCRILESKNHSTILSLKDPQTIEPDSLEIMSPNRLPRRTTISAPDSPSRSPATLKPVKPVNPSNPALVYKFKYTEGSIESWLEIKALTSAYKVNYIRSLIYLTEFLIENAVAEDIPLPKISKSGSSPNSKSNTINSSSKDEVVNLEDPKPIKNSSLKSKTTISVQQVKVEIFYKESLHCVDILTEGISVCIVSHGVSRNFSGTVRGAGIYDLHAYPFRKKEAEYLQLGAKPQKVELPIENSRYKSSLIRMTKDSYCNFTINMDSNTSSSEYEISGLEINWVQQQAMRLIDFLMYQVLEIFYPTLLSFSSHYSRENIIKFALTVLNDHTFMTQRCRIKNSVVRLVSTTEIDVSLKLSIKEVNLSNGRFILPKVININDLTYFPFGGLESDRWTIDIRGVDLSITEPLSTTTPVSEAKSVPFDLTVEVDLLKKILELSFLYTIVDDVQSFTPNYKAIFENSDQAYPQSTLKPSTSSQSIREQAKLFLSRSDEKETLYVNGRYNINIDTNSTQIVLSNTFINRLYQILGNNINFDDGMDGLLKNTYVESTLGLQVYTRVHINSCIATVPESKNSHIEVFRLGITDFMMFANKRSDYVNEMEFSATEFSATFGSTLGIPTQYLKFIDQSCFSNRQLPLALPKTTSDHPTLCTVEPYISKNLPVWGSIMMTPDMKKEIEVRFDRARIISFRFLLRLLPELISLVPVKEHEGFEVNIASKISILIKVSAAEICIPSSQEYCLVLSSRHRITF